MEMLKNNGIKKLLILFIFLLYCNVLLYLYKNTLDDFAPKHIGVAYTLIKGYTLHGYPKYLFSISPAYYTLIAMLMSVTGINEYIMSIFPFQIFLNFLVIIALSCNLIGKKKYDHNVLWILILFGFVYFSQSLTGSSSIFLWLHGIGTILFFTALLLIGKIIKKRDSKYIMLIGITTVILILTSYDASFLFLLFIFGILMGMIIDKKFSSGSTKQTFSAKKQIFSAKILIFLIFSIFLIIMLIVYYVFISQNILIESVLSKMSLFTFFNTILHFLNQFLGIANPENRLLFKYPKILTYLYIIKYLIYGIIIFLSFFALKKHLKSLRIKTRSFSIPLLYYFSSWIFVLSTVPIRIAIGHISITLIFYIVMFSIFLIVFVYQDNQKAKKFVFSILIVWLILNFTAIEVGQRYNIVHNYNYDYTITSSSWASSNIPQNASKILFPDQLTFAWWFITYSKTNNTNQLGYIYKLEDIINIYYGEQTKLRGYIIINYRSNYVFANTGGWSILEPFKNYRKNIEMNPSINQKIYTNGMLVVYYS